MAMQGTDIALHCGFVLPQSISGSCHRLRGSKIYFHQATKDRRILLIPGIHYFDAYRLQPLLLQVPALQIHLRASPLAGPEGAGETVEDPRRTKSELPLMVNLSGGGS